MGKNDDLKLTVRTAKARLVDINIISLRLIRHAEKETFEFSGPYSRVGPTKLTNHSTRTN